MWPPRGPTPALPCTCVCSSLFPGNECLKSAQTDENVGIESSLAQAQANASAWAAGGGGVQAAAMTSRTPFKPSQHFWVIGSNPLLGNMVAGRVNSLPTADGGQGAPNCPIEGRPRCIDFFPYNAECVDPTTRPC